VEKTRCLSEGYGAQGSYCSELKDRSILDKVFFDTLHDVSVGARHYIDRTVVLECCRRTCSHAAEV